MNRPFPISLCIAAIGLVLVLSRIDCGGTYPTLEGPGLTLDEVYNVEQGVYLVTALRESGFETFTFSGAGQVFDDETVYNPDHPPLGRLWLGLAHETVRRVYPGATTERISIAAGRVGTATAFAATLFLVTFFVARKVNTVAGAVAGFALLMMPRVVGHAHLGSLETFIGFFYCAAVLAAGRTADKGHRSDSRRIILAGVLVGLAMLTKIQAIFLPAAIVPWMLLTRKFGGVRSSALLLVAAGLIFVFLWPWLWLEPIDNVSQYLGRTTERQTVYNFYLDQKFGSPPPDETVPVTPWHYTIVTFLLTVPLGLHLLGLVGVVATLRKHLSDWHGAVLFGTVVPLAAFSVVAPVYDGARLFLVSFPLWAVLIGVGFSALFESKRLEKSKKLRGVLLLLFAAQAGAVAMSMPHYLSYYNLAAGSTRGADSLGMERSYWGEAATNSLWEQVPEGSTVYVAPVLDMYRLESLTKYTPIIQQRDITLKPFEYKLEDQPGLLLILHRRADQPAWLHDYADSQKPLAQVTSQGVPLASLIENDGTPFDTSKSSGR